MSTKFCSIIPSGQRNTAVVFLKTIASFPLNIWTIAEAIPASADVVFLWVSKLQYNLLYVTQMYILCHSVYCNMLSICQSFIYYNSSVIPLEFIHCYAFGHSNVIVLIQAISSGINYNLCNAAHRFFVIKIMQLWYGSHQNAASTSYLATSMTQLQQNQRIRITQL